KVHGRSPETLELLVALPLAGSGDDLRARFHGQIKRRNPKGRGCPTNEKCLALFEFEVPKETGPCRCIRFRQRSQIFPRQVRFNLRNTAYTGTPILCIAAVDRSS